MTDKLKILIILVFVCSAFIFIDDVYAENKLGIGGNFVTFDGVTSVPAGSQYFSFLETDAVYSDVTKLVPYFAFTLCTNASNIISWDTLTRIETLGIKNSLTSCDFPNNMGTGHKVYVYGKLMGDCSVQGTNCKVDSSFKFNNPTYSSWTLLNRHFSTAPITIIDDNSGSDNTDEIKDSINQGNQDIKDSINQGNQGIKDNINSSTSDIKDSINQGNQDIKDSINQGNNAINDNIDQMKEKQDEQNQTSKGIWQSLKDGIANIGNWFSSLGDSIGGFFSNLWKGIQSLFIGEEVETCTSTTNYFNLDYLQPQYYSSYSGTYKDLTSTMFASKEDGYYSLNADGGKFTFFFDTSMLKPNTHYHIFVDVQNVSFKWGGASTSGYLDIFPESFSEGRVYSNVKEPGLFYFDLTTVSDLPDKLSFKKDPDTGYTFRILITDDLSITEDNYEYFYGTKQNCTTKRQGGLFGMISDFKSSIESWFDRLFDDDVDSDVSSIGDVEGLLPAGPVDSLLNIPFQFLSVLTTSFGGVCVPLSGTFVFDSTLTFPCFSDAFYSHVPALLMTFINLIPSAFILIKYFKHLYKKVDRAVNLNANADDEWGVL